MISHRVIRHRGPLLEILFGKAKKPLVSEAPWTPIPAPLSGPQLVFDPGLQVPLPAAIKAGLEQVRQKERLDLVIEVYGLFFAAGILLIVLQMFLDYYLGLPWLARAGFLVADIVFLRWLWQRQRSLLGRELSDEKAALRVEKQFLFLEGALIGAVELSQGKPGSTQGSPGLLQALVQEASDKTNGLDMGEAVSLEKAVQWGTAAVVILGLVIFLALQTWPSCGVLAQRLVLLNPTLPSGTQVMKETENLTIPEGAPVTLSARAEGFIPAAGRVRLYYSNGQEEDIPVIALPVRPDLFSVTLPGVQKPFRYRFFLHDSEGSEYEVKIESAPVVQSLKREGEKSTVSAREDTAISGKIYWEEGRSLRLAVTSSAALKTAVLSLQDSEGKKTILPMTIEGFGRKIARVEIPEKYEKPRFFFVELTGENNLKSADHVVYVLERILSPKAMADAENKKNAAPASPNSSGLRAKDRTALFDLQSQPVPDEYTAMVRQYLKNVAGDESEP